MPPAKGGVTIIREMVNSLPPSERKIAQYILNHPEEAILLTASSLGEESNASSAAVVRLCKSLGFSGFQELKIRVAGDLQAEGIYEYRDIEPDEKFRSIINMETFNTIQSVNETIDIIDDEQLNKAVSALSHARSIIFIGVGASYIAAYDAEQKFVRINKNAYSFSDIHIAATLIANKGPDDVVVGISFSGNTREIVKLLDIAKQKGVKTISITRYGKTKLSEFSDIQLYTASKEATFRSGATSSRIAQLHIVDILFMCLASQEYDETVESLDETLKVISQLNED